MSAAEDRTPDLTTTLNISALRAVGDPLAEILERCDEETLAVLSALPARSAMLIALSGPGKGARYLLDEGNTTVGRSAESGIVLDDITVSRKHAEIESHGGRLEVRDSGSLNGTYLNGSSISNSSLKHGDELQIGKYRLHIFIGGNK